MLTIRHQRHLLEPRLPLFVFIDGHYLATMKNDEMDIDLPVGDYSLRLQFGGPVSLRLVNRIFHTDKSIDLSLSTTTPVHIKPGHREERQAVTFSDREQLWNLLFDIDLVAWIVSLFVTFPPVYKIISDAFFAVWLIRLIVIRKHYYKVTSDPSGKV